MKDFSRKIHLVGIGGAGMCPLAEVLLSRGHQLTGSDRQRSSATERLESLGIAVQYDHSPLYLKEAELMIYSSAIREDNPERVYAAEHGIPSMRRAEVLGQLMRAHYTICIAGTHGKTTTTALAGAVFQDAGLDPVVLVGGVIRGAESHAVTGTGNIMVAEADEFDRSFLAMYPSVAVITNIEADHLDCYGSLENIKDAFVSFTARVPFFGAVVACKDDPGVRDVLPRINCNVITYGIESDSDYTAGNITFASGKPSFTVYKRGTELGEIRLNIPGMHNVLNSLAVIAVADRTRISFEVIQKSLGKCQGARRRFEIAGEVKGITVIDDYAHHPGEIRATIDAARRCGYKRIVAVFQPHLYSRTRELMDGFVESLSAADSVYVTGIYKAREEAIPGVSSGLIVEKLKRGNHSSAVYVEESGDLVGILQKDLRSGDAVIMMGAGDIWQSAVKLVEALNG